MNAQHTPGPWYVADVGGHIAIGNVTVVISRIENVVSGRPIDDEDRANARLIAAAPDLLNALKSAYTFVSEHVNFGGKYPYINGTELVRDSYKVLKEINDAIVKAESIDNE